MLLLSGYLHSDWWRLFSFTFEPKTSKDRKQVPKPEHTAMFPREQVSTFISTSLHDARLLGARRPNKYASARVSREIRVTVTLGPKAKYVSSTLIRGSRPA